MAPGAEDLVLVDPMISRAKLKRELDEWQVSSADYRRRGIHLVHVDLEHMVVDVVVTARVSCGNAPPLTIVAAAVRLSYDNYDIAAPSLIFIDPASGEPAQPAIPAWDADQEPAQLLTPGVHPEHRRPFVCLPGIREYHEHPQHDNDDWLARRSDGTNRLAVICDRLQRTTAGTIVGISLEAHLLVGGGIAAVRIQQGRQRTTSDGQISTELFPLQMPVAQPPAQEQT